jgi:hypothetical protein
MMGQLEPGECILVLAGYDFNEVVQFATIHVVRADPVIRITKELYDVMANGSVHPSVTMEDGIITISGSNRTVIYKVGEFNYELGCYQCHWPD